MRAAAEYIAPEAKIVSCTTYMRRHPETGACVSGSGVVRFDDGSTTTWHCGFESGAGVQDLRISGAAGVIKLDDFLRSRRDDHAGAYEYSTGWRDRQHRDQRAHAGLPGRRMGSRPGQRARRIGRSPDST